MCHQRRDLLMQHIIIQLPEASMDHVLSEGAANLGIAEISTQMFRHDGLAERSGPIGVVNFISQASRPYFATTGGPKSFIP